MKTKIENDKTDLHGGSPSDNHNSGHGLSPHIYNSLKLPCVSDDVKNTFLILLSNSICLDKDEKLRLLHEMPTFIEIQVIDLIDFFNTEVNMWKDHLYNDFVKRYDKKISLIIRINIHIQNNKKAGVIWGEIVKELQTSILMSD